MLSGVLRGKKEIQDGCPLTSLAHDSELKRIFISLKIYPPTFVFVFIFIIFFLLGQTITIASNFLFDHVLSVRCI